MARETDIFEDCTTLSELAKFICKEDNKSFCSDQFHIMCSLVFQSSGGKWSPVNAEQLYATACYGLGIVSDLGLGAEKGAMTYSKEGSDTEMQICLTILSRLISKYSISSGHSMTIFS